MSKNIIILQHIPIETPGYILDLMKIDKFNITTIELDKGEKIPDNLSSYDAMFLAGSGPLIKLSIFSFFIGISISLFLGTTIPFIFKRTEDSRSHAFVDMDEIGRAHV